MTEGPVPLTTDDDPSAFYLESHAAFGAGRTLIQLPGWPDEDAHITRLSLAPTKTANVQIHASTGLPPLLDYAIVGGSIVMYNAAPDEPIRIPRGQQPVFTVVAEDPGELDVGAHYTLPNVEPLVNVAKQAVGEIR